MKRIFGVLVSLIVVVARALAQTNFRDVTYKEAIAAAKAEKKQVFIDFYTSWCGAVQDDDEECISVEGGG